MKVPSVRVQFTEQMSSKCFLYSYNGKILDEKHKRQTGGEKNEGFNT